MNNPRAEAKQIEMLLKTKYRVPDRLLKTYRYACCDKAVQDSHEIKANRLYTLLALVLHEQLGFGNKRVYKFLSAYSDRYEAFYNSGCDWRSLMEECRAKTGMIIRTGEEGDELCEFTDENEREYKEKHEQPI